MSSLELLAEQVHPDWTSLWLATLPAAARPNLLQNQRLGAGVGARIVAFLGAPPLPANVSGEVAELYAAYVADPQQAVDLIGLMLYGRRLARVVAGADVRLLLTRFSREALERVLSVREFLPEATEQGEMPAPDVLVMQARLAVRDWLETLPSALADRVTLTLPREPDVVALHLGHDDRIAVVEMALNLIWEAGR